MNSLKSLFWGAAVCFLFIIPAAAQKTKKAKSAKPALPTADIVIDKYLKVSNSELMCKTLSTIKAIGYLEGDNNAKLGTFTVHQMSEKFRLQMNLPDVEIIQIFDGKTGWSKENNKDWIEEKALQGSEIYNVCFDFKSNHLYPECKMKGIVDLEGNKTYQITFFKDGKLAETVYFDTTTGLILRWDTPGKTAEEKESQIYFSDYRRVGEFLMPFTMIIVKDEMGTVMKVEEYLLNIPIDEAKFNKTT